MFQEVLYNMKNELHRNYFRGKKQDFTPDISNVIKIDSPITKSCNAIPSKASRILSHHKKQSYNNANHCMFYHNYIKSRHKINCRRNGKKVKFESRRNGSRQNGSRQNGSRRNGNTPSYNTIFSLFTILIRYQDEVYAYSTILVSCCIRLA